PGKGANPRSITAGVVLRGPNDRRGICVPDHPGREAAGFKAGVLHRVRRGAWRGGAAWRWAGGYTINTARHVSFLVAGRADVGPDGDHRTGAGGDAAVAAEKVV